MPTVNLTTRHRPVRIGFLVRPGEMEDVRRAAQLCCLLWGGMGNPIIPVAAETDELADRLVQDFQVDVLMAVTKTDAIEKFMARHRWLESPRMMGRGLLTEDWRTKKNDLVYLDVMNVINRYWDEEFKHVASGSESQCRLVIWDQDDPLRDLFTVMFGAYPDDLNLRTDFRKAFLDGLRASEVRLETTQPIPADLAPRVTPARLSLADLRGHGGRFQSWPGGIYFGDGRDVADLTSFWNVRAAGGSVEFCCLATGTRLNAFAKAHIDRLDALPQRNPNIPDHIAVFFRNNEPAVKESLKALSPQKRILLYAMPSAPSDLRGLTPGSRYFDWETALAIIDRDDGDYAVTLSLPEKKFLLDGAARKSQMLAVSIDSRGDYAFPGHTLNPPFRQALTETYGRGIRVDPWGVRSEPDGIGVFIDSGERTVRLRPMKHAEVISALFGEAGLKIEPSVGGRLAERLVEGMGGYEATRIFKIRGVRNLIADLKPDTPIGRGPATQTIWNGGQFKDHERLFIEARQTPHLTTGAAFDFLLKHGFFRAGLEFKCDNCGLASWLSLRQVDDRWICEFCGFSNTTSLHVRDRGDWMFRKSGLLAKDNNQEGAIPVILTLLALTRVLNEDGLLRLTSVKVTGSVPDCEIDLIVLYHHDGEISCGIGEAKAAGGSIDAKDVENLKAVADRLSQARIRPYLICSKAADAFTPEELKLFGDTRDAGYDVIALANAELEPYHPFENAQKENLPVRYTVSFDDMVTNSEAKYLPKRAAAAAQPGTGSSSTVPPAE